VIEQLLSIVEKEDKKNPLTDGQIAEILGIPREKVNQLRHEANIPDYLVRREGILLKTIEDILGKNNNISLRKLCIELNKLGFQISTFGLNKYKNHIDEIKNRKALQNSGEDNTDHKTSKKNRTKNEDVFSNIIGWNGSLRHVIKFAKSAVLYPPNGLHTLIIGETGVGKSQLAEQMYLFTKKYKKRNIPFIVFNCADYADNPQLLVSQLFGHTKGSFTGASSEKVGLVEKANDGILFLDEIHRLPPEGQELLFRIIDKGEFNRLGETDSNRKVNLMIIGATTENIESNLLSTFRRRIPVLIEIPTLEERPIIERIKLIEKFFKMEAQRVNTQIHISGELIKCFLFYKCPGNIGQLRSDIKVSCARAFLNYISLKEKEIRLTMDDLPVHLKKQINEIQRIASDFNMINISDMIVKPKGTDGNKGHEDDIFKYNIYQFIENRMKELKEKGMPLEEIKDTLLLDLDRKISNYTSNIDKKYYGISKKLLENIVGEEIVHIVDDIKEMLLSQIGSNDFGIFNVLCLHLSTAIERLRMGKKIINPNLENIKRNYKKEYEVASKICRIIELKLALKIPEDEIGFIALYLNKLFVKENYIEKSRVGVIIVTHGDVATSILNIAQSIVGIKHGAAINMSLNEKPEEVYQRVKEEAKKINEGKGIILLVDMGSLTVFGNLITKELGIPTKTISRVDTLMVLDVLRKSIQTTSTLDTIYNSVVELDKISPKFLNIEEQNKSNNRNKIIVTTCITGKGSALKIKELVEEKLREFNCSIDVIPIGLIGKKDDITEKIKGLQTNSEIITVIGTVNPKINTIPFMTLEEAFEDKKLDVLINSIKVETKNSTDKSMVNLENLFNPKLVRVFHSIGSKEEILSIMTRIMRKEGYVKKEFYEDILNREDLGSSYIGEKMAVPHTEQDKNIIKPGIGIAIIKNPIKWDDEEVDVVFVLALSTEHKQLFLDFYSLVKDTDLIDRIKKMDDNKLMIEEIKRYIDMHKKS